MKPAVFAVELSIAAALSAASAAKADAQDFAFCLFTDATVTVSAVAVKGLEVGVVITNVGDSLSNLSGPVVVAANNFFGKGAGSEWKSGMGQFALASGNCFNVASMQRNNGSNVTCLVTRGAASDSEASIGGETSDGWMPLANVQVVGGVRSWLNNAPLVHCPH